MTSRFGEPIDPEDDPLGFTRRYTATSAVAWFQVYWASFCKLNPDSRGWEPIEIYRVIMAVAEEEFWPHADDDLLARLMYSIDKPLQRSILKWTQQG